MFWSFYFQQQQKIVERKYNYIKKAEVCVEEIDCFEEEEVDFEFIDEIYFAEIEVILK